MASFRTQYTRLNSGDDPDEDLPPQGFHLGTRGLEEIEKGSYWTLMLQQSLIAIQIPWCRIITLSIQSCSCNACQCLFMQKPYNRGQGIVFALDPGLLFPLLQKFSSVNGSEVQVEVGFPQSYNQEFPKYSITRTLRHRFIYARLPLLTCKSIIMLFPRASFSVVLFHCWADNHCVMNSNTEV